MRWLLVAVACAACYRDAAPPAAPPEPPRHARTAADPLAFLPADAELVVSVDAAQLRSSALWQKVQPALTAKLGDMLAAFAAECGYDPVAAVKRITLGISNARARRPRPCSSCAASIATRRCAASSTTPTRASPCTPASWPCAMALRRCCSRSRRRRPRCS